MAVGRAPDALDAGRTAGTSAAVHAPQPPLTSSPHTFFSTLLNELSTYPLYSALRHPVRNEGQRRGRLLLHDPDGLS